MLLRQMIFDLICHRKIEIALKFDVELVLLKKINKQGLYIAKLNNIDRPLASSDCYFLGIAKADRINLKEFFIDSIGYYASARASRA